jgi:hypothetical protein
MSIEIFFSQRKRDLTQYMNAATAAIVSKGIVSGGVVKPATTAGKVKIEPFVAVSYDGMVMKSDTSYEVTVKQGELRHVVLRAKYKETGEPQLEFSTLSDAAYIAVYEKNYLIKFAEVTQSGASVANADVDMVSTTARDAIDPQGRVIVRGSVATVADLPADSTPKTHRNGDGYLVRDSGAIYFWDSLLASWKVWGSGIYLPLAGGIVTGLTTFQNVVVFDDPVGFNSGLELNGILLGNPGSEIQVPTASFTTVTADVVRAVTSVGWNATKTFRKRLDQNAFTRSAGGSESIEPLDASRGSGLIVLIANAKMTAEFTLPVGAVITEAKVRMALGVGALNANVLLQREPFANPPVDNGWVTLQTLNGGTVGLVRWTGPSGFTHTVLADNTYRLYVVLNNVGDVLYDAYIKYQMQTLLYDNGA